MKIRTFLTSLVLLATVFASCKKEIPEIVNDIPMGNTVIEVPNPYTHNKTHYQNGAVKWNEGDQIAVARGNGSFVKFTIINSTINQDPVLFTGNLDDSTTDGNYYAVYPYMEGLSVMDGVIHLPQAIKSTQTLTPGGFGNGDNVMVGMSTSTEMYFQNVGGLIKISLQGTDVQLQSITIKSMFTGDAGKMSGPATINMFSSTPTIEWASSGCSNQIKLVSETGVDLTNGKTFYIVAPQKTNEMYRISMKDMLGNTVNFGEEVSTLFEFAITRASITNIGNYNVTASRDPNKIYFTTTNGTLDAGLRSRFEALGNDCEINGTNGSYSATYSVDVTSLPTDAFMHCSTLKSITLPNTITEFVGDDHFYDCGNIQTIQMPTNSSFVKIPNYCFMYCYKLTSVNIPSSVTEIGTFAFSVCEKLSTIELPAGLTTIGNEAFGRTNISSITFPTGVTVLPDDVCYYCPNLNSVQMLGQVTSIGIRAFYGTPISSITIPSSIESIANHAFYSCENLSSVTCKKTTPISLGDNAFLSISRNATLYVPGSAISAYQNSDWNQYFGGGVMSIR